MCHTGAGQGKRKQADHTLREMSGAGQGKRKQAEHTPRKMSGGASKEEAS